VHGAYSHASESQGFEKYNSGNGTSVDGSVTSPTMLPLIHGSTAPFSKSSVQQYSISVRMHHSHRYGHAHGHSSPEKVASECSRNNATDAASSSASAAVLVPPVSASQASVPTNDLTASRAKIVEAPIFNDSTAAFGTTRCSNTNPIAKQTTLASTSTKGIYDSTTVSLTAVGAQGVRTRETADDNDKKTLENTLHQFVATGAPFLMQYVMEGPVRWRLGSRGAVQFARSRLTGEKVWNLLAWSKI
jgi:hypothetical protein